MNRQQLPWSFYAILVSFAIFFGCLNIYILTLWLNHPLANNLWLVGTIIGAVLLICSIHVMRVHQKEMVEKIQEISAD